MTLIFENSKLPLENQKVLYNATPESVIVLKNGTRLISCESQGLLSFNLKKCKGADSDSVLSILAYNPFWGGIEEWIKVKIPAGLINKVTGLTKQDEKYVLLMRQENHLYDF